MAELEEALKMSIALASRGRITYQPFSEGLSLLGYAAALRYALEKSLLFHRHPPEVRKAQIIRIMKEAREEYDLAKMIAAYIRIYEKLNGGKPLD